MHDLAPGSQFASDVRAGLTQPEQKTLGCRYLYDDMGWALREAIALLPEYGLTRADARIIEAHANDLLDCLPSPLTIAELGSGSVATTRTILEAVRKRQKAVYYPIDVPATALARCARELGPLAAVHPLEMSFLDGLRNIAGRRAPGERLLVLFTGSSIGNFEPEAAIHFVDSIRRRLAPGDALLLGTDLVKPTAQLLDAYDDPTLVAQSFGRGDLRDCRRTLVNGVWLGAALSPLLVLVLWATIPLLRAVGTNPRALAIFEPYLKALTIGVLPLLLYTAFRRYLQAVNLVKPITFALVSANLINIAGDWALMYGHCGAPALGVPGSGFSTSISRT